MRRVAVTGIGVICGIGRNREEFRCSLRAGRSGIAPFNNPQLAELRFQTAAQVRGFDPAEHFSLKEADMIDRFAQFAVVAAREAVVHSGIEWTPELREETGIVTGACVGGQSTEDQGFRDVYKQGKPRVHPMTIPKTMANAGASAISLDLGITGPAFTISTACSSSAHAIGQAFGMVRQGMCDVAIAGGSEAPLSYGLLKAWEAMRVVSPSVCRPFSKDRNGMILGEGGAMLVLESLDHALERGAEPLAEMVGFGMSSDAHHITQPSAEGAAKAIRMALRDAGIAPESVGYVNAHGTGTTVNDVTETRALKMAFGQHAQRLAISSTKAMHWHTLGAAGAIEAAATIFTLVDGVLPPTVNFSEPDPECDLDYVANCARTLSVEYAASNSFAFGGLNAVLVFRRNS
jgi:nodulation protein E